MLALIPDWQSSCGKIQASWVGRFHLARRSSPRKGDAPEESLWFPGSKPASLPRPPKSEDWRNAAQTEPKRLFLLLPFGCTAVQLSSAFPNVFCTHGSNAIFKNQIYRGIFLDLCTLKAHYNILPINVYSEYNMWRNKCYICWRTRDFLSLLVFFNLATNKTWSLLKTWNNLQFYYAYFPFDTSCLFNSIMWRPNRNPCTNVSMTQCL